MRHDDKNAECSYLQQTFKTPNISKYPDEGRYEGMPLLISLNFH